MKIGNYAEFCCIPYWWLREHWSCNGFITTAWLNSSRRLVLGSNDRCWWMITSSGVRLILLWIVWSIEHWRYFVLETGQVRNGILTAESCSRGRPFSTFLAATLLRGCWMLFYKRWACGGRLRIGSCFAGFLRSGVMCDILTCVSVKSAGKFFV